MKENTPEEIKQAVEHLLHTVAKYQGAVVVGYVFCAEPIYITSISNVHEGQFIQTMDTVHQLAKTKIAQGMVVKNRVGRPV